MIRVLVVDDSALIRRILTDMLNSAPDIEVVGAATDPFMARDKIKALNPDVLTLDIEMPRMDGITFLRNLMRLHPMPVVMVSTLTEQGAEITLEALSIGAVDFVTKPKMDVARTLTDYVDELTGKIRTAARARFNLARRRSGAEPPRPRPPTPSMMNIATTEKIIAIGASTGGTEAIKDVLMGMPPDAPGIVIAQHIPQGFSGAFAERMNRMTKLSVKEAEHGDQVLPGHAFVAPGGMHLELARNGTRYFCRVLDTEPVNRHKPSVDVLFRSVLKAAGKNACAAILTGMGADGADGITEMNRAGLFTVAQDEATSIVWGMPGEAVKRNGVNKVLALDEIATALLGSFQA
ncbi:MAG: chemotaxis response regulator protein-glutamate methylesterase [Wenzhouxiangellaceae bacterium]|nr:chemotaxis response regulator protein-glutamate methylesterase [Wenzhouxiangellaceae bacterium]